MVHWFQNQRLLDPAVDSRRISVGSEFSGNNQTLVGWLIIERAGPYDAGNYTCVPSYAVPASAEVQVIHHGNEISRTCSQCNFNANSLFVVSDKNLQQGLLKEVSEVKVDVSSATAIISLSSPINNNLLIVPIAFNWIWANKLLR